jgi:channel protein (hemolysin III family)
MEILPWIGFHEPFSSMTHLLAAVAAFIGSFFLVAKGRGNGARVTSLIVFSFSVIFLYSMSGVYHMLTRGGDAREVMQRLDYAGIWVLIAGTFTPVHIILFRGAWRWAILLLVWILAITSLVLEVVFFKDFPEWLTLTLFLGLGWMGALTGYKFKTSFHGESLKFLILGGMFYSFGAVIDFIRVPILWPGVIHPHEIFHVFVILGTLCHWIFIYQWADHPVANTITFHITIFPDNKYVAEAIGDHMKISAHSLEDLKKQILKGVAQKYHESIIPIIRLKYFNEEILRLKPVDIAN